MQLRIKICGITCLADAHAAVNAGADALGFMFYDRSKRYITPEAVAKITADLPPFVFRVGVFVDPAAEEVAKIAHLCGLTALQFHGSESPEFCANLALPVIKAFRMCDKMALHELPKYRTSAWLLDSAVPGQFGGTGEKFDWRLARDAAKLGRPVILAGGLTPENVGDAVREARPYGVDVSSGVESAPGKKDRAKINAFIRGARAAAEEIESLS
jgi:phosphoribosylanthranilate isomerase